jgi:hypothetical protein
MFTRQNVVRLLLAGLLLALLAVPVLGIALGTGVATNDVNDSTLVFNLSPVDGSGVAIACQTGGNQGEGC